jgi:hypothetical protein
VIELEPISVSPGGIFSKQLRGFVVEHARRDAHFAE